MPAKWINWINYCLIAFVIVLLFAALIYLIIRPTQYDLPVTSLKNTNLPKNAFSCTPEQYSAIESPALELKFAPLNVQLPDLRRYLVYYGKNARPDAKEERLVLYFSFTGNKSPTSILPGQPYYVLYDKTQNANQYVFSPNNAPTPLWLEASVLGNQAIVKVAMEGESGQVIKEPSSHAEFTLPEKELTRGAPGGGATGWDLGKWRVDGTLLARQKARWFGIDRFLERHGGEEYKDWKNKQRIDFGDGDDAYSVYVSPEDCLIWKDNRWYSSKPSQATLKYPLMCVKKIDDRIMNLDLWDVDGKGKIVLNLIKTNETWAPQALEQSFKVIGARTKSQFIFEINQERMLLRPHDWLLMTESGWKKLATPQDIDDYVERKKTGPLFIFDGIEKRDDRQVITGTLFNTARTEMTSFDLPIQQSASTNAPSQGKKTPGQQEKRQKMRESNHPPMLKNDVKQLADKKRAILDNDDDDDDDE